jgi:hypothetical protein
VELLVVIAVIAILAALLFPGLNAGRLKAAQVTCCNNLRQLMQANVLYSTDWNGHLPYPSENSYQNNGWWRGAGWLYRPPRSSPPTITNLMTGVLWPYLKHSTIYHCPLHQGPFGNGTECITSYVMNWEVIGLPYGGVPSDKPSYRFSDFRPSDLCMWETDYYGYGATWDDGCNQPNGGVSKRHLSGAPIAGFDGRVEWIGFDEYYNGINNWQRPNRYWCNPLSQTRYTQ